MGLFFDLQSMANFGGHFCAHVIIYSKIYGSFHTSRPRAGKSTFKVIHARAFEEAVWEQATQKCHMEN